MACQSVTKIYDQYATMAVASWHVFFSQNFKFVKRTLLTVTVRLSDDSDPRLYLSASDLGRQC